MSQARERLGLRMWGVRVLSFEVIGSRVWGEWAAQDFRFFGVFQGFRVWFGV